MNTCREYARTEDLYQSDLKSVQGIKSLSRFSTNRRIKLLNHDSKSDCSHPRVVCSNRSSCPRLVIVRSDSSSLGLLFKMAAIDSITRQRFWLTIYTSIPNRYDNS